MMYVQSFWKDSRDTHCSAEIFKIDKLRYTISAENNDNNIIDSNIKCHELLKIRKHLRRNYKLLVYLSP